MGGRVISIYTREPIDAFGEIPAADDVAIEARFLRALQDAPYPSGRNLVDDLIVSPTTVQRLAFRGLADDGPRLLAWVESVRETTVDA